MAVVIPDDVQNFCTEGERHFYGFLKTAAKPDSKCLLMRQTLLPGGYFRKELCLILNGMTSSCTYVKECSRYFMLSSVHMKAPK